MESGSGGLWFLKYCPKVFQSRRFWLSYRLGTEGEAEVDTSLVDEMLGLLLLVVVVLVVVIIFGMWGMLLGGGSGSGTVKKSMEAKICVCCDLYLLLLGSSKLFYSIFIRI